MVLLFVVSFEEILFGAMMSMTDEEKCSTNAINVGGKCTHGKDELALEKMTHKEGSRKQPQNQRGELCNF